MGIIFLLGLTGVCQAQMLFQTDFENNPPTYGFPGMYDGTQFREEHTTGWSGQGSRLTVLRGERQFDFGWYGSTGREWSAGDVMYVRFRVRFDDNWRWDGSGSQQNKMFDLGVGGSGESRVILHQEKPHGKESRSGVPEIAFRLQP